MEECTKVAVQYGVHIEVVGVRGIIRRLHPIGTQRASNSCSLSPVELGRQSTIPHRPTLVSHALRCWETSIHGRARGRPRHTSPFPLNAEVVAVTSPESAEAADCLFIGRSSKFSTS